MFDADKTPIAMFELQTKDEWGNTDYAHAKIRFGYEDETDHTPRWFDSDHPLSELEITSQGNSRDDERRLYGYETRYKGVYSVDLRKAETMAKTLRKLDKALTAENDQLGYATDWPEYARRVLKALGVKQVWFTRKRGRFFSEGEYRVERKMGDAVSSMRYQIGSWERHEDEAQTEYSLA